MPAAIPALLDITAFLVAVMVLLIAYGVLVSYRYTLGPVLGGLASVWDHLHIPFTGNPARELDNKIKAGLAAAVSGAEWAVQKLWLGTAELFHYIGSEIAGLAADVDHALARLAGGATSKLRKWVIAFVAKEFKGFRKWAVGFVGGLVGALGKLITAAHHAIATLRKTVVALDHELGALRGFTRKQLRALLKKLGALGWLGVFAGVGALVGAGLAALGLKWLTCEATKTFGRRLCGNDGRLLNGLLDDLLTAGVDILAVTHLCELVGGIQRAALEFEPVLHGLVVAAESYVCAGHDGAASGITASDWAPLSGSPTAV